jgi:hypothetical protein
MRRRRTGRAQVHADRIQEHVFAGWARLLHAAGPAARLRLRQGADSAAHHAALARHLAAAAAAALSPRAANGTAAPPPSAAAAAAARRLEFLPKLPERGAHVRRLAGGTLFLDTDAYSAHSTALDALYAGQPVVTSPRESAASRAPAGFLAALGLLELVARGRADYEALAARLLAPERGAVVGAATGGDGRRGRRRTRRVEAVRRRLAARRAAGAALFDPGILLTALARAVCMLWEVHEVGPPESGRAGWHVIVAQFTT